MFCFLAVQTKIHLTGICCGRKMFLRKFRNIFCVSDAKFASATNVACARKQGNICVRNNVSLFAGTFNTASKVTNRGSKMYKTPGGVLPKKLVRGVRPASKTLTLFMTKIGDFPYPIYDLTKHLIPYL